MIAVFSHQDEVKSHDLSQALAPANRPLRFGPGGCEWLSQRGTVQLVPASASAPSAFAAKRGELGSAPEFCQF